VIGGVLKKVAVVLTALPLALAACGGTGAVKLAKDSKDPAVQKREKEAQAIVQGCIAKGNFLSHAGRQKILACIAPPGHKAEFEACAQKVVAHGHFLTHSGRKKTTLGVADCLETNR
jgi:predicted small lipoprotein YifL